LLSRRPTCIKNLQKCTNTSVASHLCQLLIFFWQCYRCKVTSCFGLHISAYYWVWVSLHVLVLCISSSVNCLFISLDHFSIDLPVYFLIYLQVFLFYFRWQPLSTLGFVNTIFQLDISLTLVSCPLMNRNIYILILSN
jgi:hypothetical protein